MNLMTRKNVQGSPKHYGSTTAWTATARTVLLLMIAALLRNAASAAPGDNNLPASIRIGIAPGTWQGVNRNDASSAIAAWAKIIMQQRGISLEVETTLLEEYERSKLQSHTGKNEPSTMTRTQP